MAKHQIRFIKDCSYSFTLGAFSTTSLETGKTQSFDGVDGLGAREVKCDIAAGTIERVSRKKDGVSRAEYLNSRVPDCCVLETA